MKKISENKNKCSKKNMTNSVVLQPPPVLVFGVEVELAGVEVCERKAFADCDARDATSACFFVEGLFGIDAHSAGAFVQDAEDRLCGIGLGKWLILVLLTTPYCVLCDTKKGGFFWRPMRDYSSSAFTHNGRPMPFLDTTTRKGKIIVFFLLQHIPCGRTASPCPHAAALQARG